MLPGEPHVRDGVGKRVHALIYLRDIVAEALQRDDGYSQRVPHAEPFHPPRCARRPGPLVRSTGRSTWPGRSAVAVPFGHDDKGGTIDLIEDKVPPVLWIPNAAAVERNIELGLVERPQVCVNGAVVWQRPEERR